MNYKILIVDDEADHRKLAKRLIEDYLKLNAITADGGKEAIHLMMQHVHNPFDLVLLDISMPEVNGIDVLHSIRPIFPNLPVIARTAYDDVDLNERVINAGANICIKKQDGIDYLIHVINDTLANGKVAANDDQYQCLDQIILGL